MLLCSSTGTWIMVELEFLNSLEITLLSLNEDAEHQATDYTWVMGPGKEHRVPGSYSYTFSINLSTVCFLILKHT